MINTQHAVSLALICAITACCCLDGASCVVAGELLTDPDAYSVYEFVLPSVWMVANAHATSYVIVNETDAMDMCLQPDESSMVVIGSAIESYNRANEHTWQISPKLQLGIPYVLISPEERQNAGRFVSQIALDRIVKEHVAPDSAYVGVVGEFETRFPGARGYVTLSAVGFNCDKTVAVVSMQYYCGFLCAGGNFFVLQKTDGQWHPLDWKGKGCAWVS